MSSSQERHPDHIRAQRETVLLRLLIRTSQAETNELVSRLQDLGHTTVSPSYISLLGNIDTEGTRLGTVSDRVGTTRQAVSQLVKEIESRGYLERAPDPDDGRAVLIRHTAAGRRLLASALEIMGEIEDRYESIIGERRMAQLKRTLAMLADEVDAASRLEHR